MTMGAVPRSTAYTIIFAVIIVAVALIMWYAISVFLLGFAAILFAIFLSSIAEFFRQDSKVSYPLALATVLVTLAGIFILTIWLYSPLITEQFQALIEQLPKAYEQLKLKTEAFFKQPFLSEKDITSQFLFKSDQIFQQIVSIFSGTIGTIASFIIFLFVGIYLAFNPDKYTLGFLQLITPSKRAYASKVLAQTAHALRWWLFGKIIVMLLIGITTYIGLTLLRIPLALILAVVAGLLTFIPYLGPILGAIPAILIALSISPLKALYVTLLYIGLHTAEGYLVAPYIDQKTVLIPPALTIMVQVLAAFLMGFLGLALATPLTVVAFVLLGKVYK